MLKRLVQLLLVASWPVALVLSFQEVEQRSASLPLSHREFISVLEWAGDQAASEVRRDLRQLSATHGFTFGQMVASVQDNRGARTIYLAGPRAEEIVQTQPRVDFGSAMHTSFAPMTPIETHSLVGDWVVYGDPGDIRVVLKVLQDHGAEAYLEYPPGFPRIEPLFGVVAVVALVLSAACAALVVSRTRRYAIDRLHGGALARSWLKELRHLLLAWAATGAVVLPLGGMWTVLSYGGVGVAELLSQTLFQGAFFLVFAVLSTLLVLGAVYGVDLVRALKGELPARAVIVASYALRAGATVLALGALSSSVTLGVALAHQSNSLEAMRGLNGAHFVTLGRANSNEAQDRMGSIVAPWLRSQDLLGRVLLADVEHLNQTGGELLIVNPQYLEKNSITLPDGRDAKDALALNGATVLIPQHRWAHRDALTAQVQGLAAVNAGKGDVPIHPVISPDGLRLPIFGIPSDIAGRHSGEQETTFVEDPVVLVVPAQFINGYVSAASRGRVLVFEADSLRAQIAQDPELSRFILSITPVETRAAHIASDKLLELRKEIFSTVLATAVAIFAGISLAIAYGKLRSSRIFVGYLHGRPALFSYRMLLAGEVLLSGAILAWEPLTVMRLRAQHEAMASIGSGLGPVPTLRLMDVLPAAGIVLTVSGGLLVTLVYAHRRIIRQGISEA